MSTCQMLQNFTDSSYNRSTAMSDCFEYMQKIAPQESSNSLDNEENWYDQYYPDVPSEVSEYEAHMQRYEESKSHAPHSFTSEELSMMPPNMGAYRLYYELKLQTDPNFSSSVSMTNNSQPSFERSSGRQKESKKSPEKWSFCTLL